LSNNHVININWREEQTQNKVSL